MSKLFESGKEYKLSRDLAFCFISDNCDEYSEEYIKEHTFEVCGYQVFGWRKGTVVTMKDDKGYFFSVDGEDVEICDYGYMDTDNNLDYTKDITPSDFLEEV